MGTNYAHTSLRNSDIKLQEFTLKSLASTLSIFPTHIPLQMHSQGCRSRHPAYSAPLPSHCSFMAGALPPHVPLSQPRRPCCSPDRLPVSFSDASTLALVSLSCRVLRVSSHCPFLATQVTSIPHQSHLSHRCMLVSSWCLSLSMLACSYLYHLFSVFLSSFVTWEQPLPRPSFGCGPK